MNWEQIAAIVIGAVVASGVRFLADRFPTPGERRRRELENRMLEAQIEQLEHDNEKEE